MVRDGYIYGLSLAGGGGSAGVGYARLGVGDCRPCCWRHFFCGSSAIRSGRIPVGRGLIVSPGDGLVTETVTISTPEGPRQRISIFLSVFDVHVNRSPIGGVLTRCTTKRANI